MEKLWKKSVLSLILFSTTCLVWAIPGYRVNDQMSSDKAVNQYAEDNDKFGAVVYQAEMDKNEWQLALAAYRYLEQRPKDPHRKCSFAMAYWRSKEVSETVPLAAEKQLQGLFEEASRATKEAAVELPKSYSAHLTYGQYFLSYVNGMEKVQRMLYEFHAAETIRPDLGITHYWLAEGYAGSGNTSLQAVDKMLAEFQIAIKLDPRLTESYFAIASLYDWPCHTNYKMSKFYLDKYLKAKPEQANRPDVIAFSKYLKQKITS